MDKIEGFLEVGHTEDTHEVVINHPDLKPDEDGVGHIVFSPQQARRLAELLASHARQAEVAAALGCAQKQVEPLVANEREGETITQEISDMRLDAATQRRALEVLKHKSEQHGAQVCTTDGKPPDPDYAELGNAPKPVRANGQHESYYVLCAEERAKGFVRPVRRSYRHVKCGSITSMGLALAETYARDPHFYGATFCVQCGTHFPLLADGVRQFVWLDDAINEQDGVGE